MQPLVVRAVASRSNKAIRRGIRHSLVVGGSITPGAVRRMNRPRWLPVSRRPTSGHWRAENGPAQKAPAICRISVPSMAAGWPAHRCRDGMGKSLDTAGGSHDKGGGEAAADAFRRRVTLEPFSRR